MEACTSDHNTIRNLQATHEHFNKLITHRIQTQYTPRGTAKYQLIACTASADTGGRQLNQDTPVLHHAVSNALVTLSEFINTCSPNLALIIKLQIQFTTVRIYIHAGKEITPNASKA